MKKSIILLVLIIFTFSCEENSLDDTSIDQISKSINYMDTYNDIVEVDDLVEQLIIANSLRGIEKYNMWQIKLDNFKENNSLNGEQTEYVDNLKNLITIELFENENNREDFNLQQKDNLLDEAKELFGDELGYYLLTKFENSNQTIDKIESTTNSGGTQPIAPISGCNCSKDGHCARLTGVGLFSLNWEYGVCTFTQCYRRSIEILGWELWESSDNGRCEY